MNTNHQPPTTNHQPPTTNHQPPTTNHQPLQLHCNNGFRSLYADDFKNVLQNFSDHKHECQNKSVFLLASGPSAGDFPVARYADYHFISMNGSVARLADEKIRPLFYICNDVGFPAGRPDLAVLGCNLARHIAMSLECFSEIYLHDRSALTGKSIHLLERVNRYYNKKSFSDRYFAWHIRNHPELVGSFSLLHSTANRIGFSKNIDYGYFCARTIIYVALQLVYSIGFSRVFIVGMDLDGNAGRFYENDKNRLPTALDEQFESLILPSFQLVSKKIINNDFRVFNLSSNSRLPEKLIPKITPGQLDRILMEKE